MIGTKGIKWLANDIAICENRRKAVFFCWDLRKYNNLRNYRLIIPKTAAKKWTEHAGEYVAMIFLLAKSYI
ncbi:hypothetical protein [Paenibacillus sp.]|jgi:hypothetical protein|uniref:hypothetical protein n=1 Tax=Paenibacillus sp. TaxID=58172 RepID=UPI0028299843|nr:hypothetical protein [Paenibacillus sp.]MDR0270105.1 hypothetical protein [Paenibacillus sp.]